MGACACFDPFSSLQDFDIFAAVDAEEMMPVLHPEYKEAMVWEVLKEHWAVINTQP